MSGLYIHIPFCRKACHYCDFHFSTKLDYRDRMIEALVRELGRRAQMINPPSPLQTIYLGGGTPSLLSAPQLLRILSVVADLFDVVPEAEITLEANPEDMSSSYLESLRALGVNRLSVGIQSFEDHWLTWMNRVHNSTQAVSAIQNAVAVGFESISIDMIYGNPGQSIEQWREDLERALDFELEHYSCYALTVEKGTALGHRVEKGLQPKPMDANQSRHFDLLMDMMEERGYEHYEISNFSMPGSRSRHNSAYWSGIPYLGIGPSAHGYDGVSRYWNIAQNAGYMKSIEEGILPESREVLSAIDRYQEWLMVSLRRVEGCDTKRLETEFAPWREDFLAKADKLTSDGLLLEQGSSYVLTRQGKHLADWVTMEMFPG